MVDTVWILGDQINRSVASLAGREPGSCRVLLIESGRKIRSKRWHRQRLHLVLSSMAHLADEFRSEGFHTAGLADEPDPPSGEQVDDLDLSR